MLPMDKLAVEQAKIKLQKAENALQALNEATDYQSAENAWSDLITAASTIYSKLEQGSKTNGTSAAWFGRKKKERRDDPLLRYLHYARNSDEHGVELIVEKAGNQAAFGRKLKFGEKVPVKVRLATQKDEEATDGMLYGPTIGLVRVHDKRFNDGCDPPMQHLGQEICVQDNSIYGKARLAVEFLRKLVAEAEALTTTSP
jgi:hypothetical protein